MGAGQASAPGRGLLVAVQVAGTLVLLIATGLCLRSFAKLSSLDLGFNPAQVLTFSVNGLDEEQFPSRAARHDLVDRLIASIEQVPQVRTAGAVFQRPFEHGPIGMDSSVLLEGQADTPDESNRNGMLNWESVTPRYFDSMNIRLLRGRIFDERDSANAGLSAIVSEATANRLWPGQDPIGRRVRLSFTEDDPMAHRRRRCRHGALPGDHQSPVRHLCRDAAVHERRPALHRPHNWRSSECHRRRSTRQSRTWTRACQSAG